MVPDKLVLVEQNNFEELSEISRPTVENKNLKSKTLNRFLNENYKKFFSISLVDIAEKNFVEHRLVGSEADDEQQSSDLFHWPWARKCDCKKHRNMLNETILKLNFKSQTLFKNNSA